MGASSEHPGSARAERREGATRPVRIAAHDVQLGGELVLPPDAVAIVVFVAGGGQASTRNHDIAAALQRDGFATLVCDLLTVREELADRLSDAYSLNITLLAARLATITRWCAARSELSELPLGYFAVGTGAAAALAAAAQHDHVLGIVARGGRPDLAGDALPEVTAATLFIAGGLDRHTMVANRVARERMRRARTELAIIPGAGPFFEERNAVAEVSRLASDWFRAALVVPSIAS